MFSAFSAADTPHLAIVFHKTVLGILRSSEAEGDLGRDDWEPVVAVGLADFAHGNDYARKAEVDAQMEAAQVQRVMGEGG